MQRLDMHFGRDPMEGLPRPVPFRRDSMEVFPTHVLFAHPRGTRPQ